MHVENGTKTDRKEYMRDFIKNKTVQRKIAFSTEDNEIIGRYCDHIGQGFSEMVRNLILADMNKNGWEELIKPPKNDGKKPGNA